MGYVMHHAIIVTGTDEKQMTRVRKACLVIAEKHQDSLGRNAFDVTQLTFPTVNSHTSFMIAPDGSKESFPQSQAGDEAREEVKQLLREERYLHWVEVRFGQPDLFGHESLPLYGEVIAGRGHKALDENDQEITLPINTQSELGLEDAAQKFYVKPGSEE
jgi:hypothetical protein